MKVPDAWNGQIDRILISPERLASRIQKVARNIEEDYQTKDLLVVALLTGTVMFLGDLVRHLSIPLHLDFMGVSSYRSRTTSGRLVYTKELALDVRGRDVLLVDDILDTGKTLIRVVKKLKKLSPKSIRLCVLLNKKSRRLFPIEADYVCFQIPDEFVVGYGLDYAERFRNLPFVGILKK